MNRPDPYGEQEVHRIQNFIYLIPVLGFFPALWTLYREEGTKEQRSLSRLSVTLATGWILGYLLLNGGAQASDQFALPLLITSSLLTSGYFFVNVWLMVRLWRRKSIRLPGVSQISDRLP